MTGSLKFAIIGCGLIGQKRARALGRHQLTVAADLDLSRAVALAKDRGDIFVTDNWQAAVERDDVDAVIVATTNNFLAPITLAAARAGKHVLVEKPAALNAGELAPVIDAAAARGVTVQVGFNHRYHPAFLKAFEIWQSGALGPMMFIRARYGHGGRVGYEKEWRAIPEIAGGGELIDQGVHIIDLSRLFLGEFVHIDGYLARYFWDMPVEDNAFLNLRTAGNQVAWLHASCTEWKNLFSFEIYGRYAKLHIEGLGGSYGIEKLAYYQMLPEMGPPPTTIWEYLGEDLSWQREFAAFIHAIETKTPPWAGLADARAALEIVDYLYQGVKP